MPITLNLAPEDEAQLKGIAAQRGQRVETVAYDLLAVALTKFHTRHNVPEGVEPTTYEKALQGQ